MNAYIPYYFMDYNSQGWRILESPVNRMRRYGRGWACNGRVYDEHAFTTEEAAQAWIDKNYMLAFQFEYMPLRAAI